MIDTEMLLDSLGADKIGEYLGLTEDTIERLRSAKVYKKKLITVIINENALGTDAVANIIKYM